MSWPGLDATIAAAAVVQGLSEQLLKRTNSLQPKPQMDDASTELQASSLPSNQGTPNLTHWEPSSKRAFDRFRQLQIHKPPGAVSTGPATSTAAAAATGQPATVSTSAAPGSAPPVPDHHDQGLLSSRLAAEQARTTRLHTALQESQCLQSYYALERQHLLLQLQQLHTMLAAALVGPGESASAFLSRPGGCVDPNAVAAAMAAVAESEVGLQVAAKQLPPDAAVAALSSSPCDALKRLATAFDQLQQMLCGQLRVAGEQQGQLQQQLEQAHVQLLQQQEGGSKELSQQRSRYQVRLLQLRKACAAEAEQLSRQATQLQQLLQQSTAKQEQLEQQLSEALQKEAASQQLLRDVQLQLARESAELQDSARALQQLHQEHEAATGQLAALQQEHEQLTSALLTATSQLEEAAEQLTAAEVRIQELDQQQQQSSASATEHAAAAAQARIQLKKARDQAKQAAVGAAARSEQLTVLRAKASQAAQQVAAARAATKEATQQLQEQRQLCSQQAAALEELRQELAAARQAAAVAGKEQRAEAARASTAEAALAAARAAASAADVTCQLLQQEVEALRQQVAAAEALSAQHQQQGVQQQQLVEALQQQLSDSKNELASRHRRLVEAAQQLKAVKRQAATAMKELDGVRSDVELWSTLRQRTYSSGGCGGRRQRVPLVGELPWGSPGAAQYLAGSAGGQAADILQVYDTPMQQQRHQELQRGGKQQRAAAAAAAAAQDAAATAAVLDAQESGHLQQGVFEQALQLEELLREREEQLALALHQVQELQAQITTLEQQVEAGPQQQQQQQVPGDKPAEKAGDTGDEQQQQQLALQLAVAEAQLQQQRCRSQLREQELVARLAAAQEEAAGLHSRLYQLQALLDNRQQAQDSAGPRENAAAPAARAGEGFDESHLLDSQGNSSGGNQLVVGESAATVAGRAHYPHAPAATQAAAAGRGSARQRRSADGAGKVQQPAGGGGRRSKLRQLLQGTSSAKHRHHRQQQKEMSVSEGVFKSDAASGEDSGAFSECDGGLPVMPRGRSSSLRPAELGASDHHHHQQQQQQQQQLDDVSGTSSLEQSWDLGTAACCSPASVSCLEEGGTSEEQESDDPAGSDSSWESELTRPTTKQQSSKQRPLPQLGAHKDRRLQQAAQTSMAEAASLSAKIVSRAKLLKQQQQGMPSASAAAAAHRAAAAYQDIAGSRRTAARAARGALAHNHNPPQPIQQQQAYAANLAAVQGGHTVQHVGPVPATGNPTGGFQQQQQQHYLKTGPPVVSQVTAPSCQTQQVQQWQQQQQQPYTPLQQAVCSGGQGRAPPYSLPPATVTAGPYVTPGGVLQHSAVSALATGAGLGLQQQQQQQPFLQQQPTHQQHYHHHQQQQYEQQGHLSRSQVGADSSAAAALAADVEMALQAAEAALAAGCSDAGAS